MKDLLLEQVKKQGNLAQTRHQEPRGHGTGPPVCAALVVGQTSSDTRPPAAGHGRRKLARMALALWTWLVVPFPLPVKRPSRGLRSFPGGAQRLSRRDLGRPVLSLCVFADYPEPSMSHAGSSRTCGTVAPGHECELSLPPCSSARGPEGDAESPAQRGSQGLVAAPMCPVACVCSLVCARGSVSVTFTPRMLGNRNAVHAETLKGTFCTETLTQTQQRFWPWCAWAENHLVCPNGPPSQSS